MAKRKYSIEAGGPTHIEITWKWTYKNISVYFDGKELEPATSKTDIKRGIEFILPDKSLLKVKSVQSELQVLRNDMPLPGSDSHPVQHLKYTYWTIYFIGVANIILGLLTQLSKINLAYFGPESIGVGLIFLALGYWVKRHSRLALWLAVIIYTVDIPYFSLKGLRAEADHSLFIYFLVIRLFLLFRLTQGFGAIANLNPKIQKKLKDKFEKRAEELRQNFEKKSSKELLNICSDKDNEDWSEEATEVARRIIAERDNAQL